MAVDEAGRTVSVNLTPRQEQYEHVNMLRCAVRLRGHVPDGSPLACFACFHALFAVRGLQ